MSENTKTPHVHCELIRKWSGDVSKVVLYNDHGTWVVTETPVWHVDRKYFVVCEKHADAALHWLNGGRVECRETVAPSRAPWRRCNKPNFYDDYEYRKVLSQEQIIAKQIEKLKTKRTEYIITLQSINAEIERLINNK
jgi:hypothetical protein